MVEVELVITETDSKVVLLEIGKAVEWVDWELD